jgi:hypothetical protein
MYHMSVRVMQAGDPLEWLGLGFHPATAACAGFVDVYPTFGAYFIKNTYLPALGRTVPFP